MSKITASVDIGGTFTDIIIQSDGKITGYYKVPTTPRNPEIGASSGLKDHLGRNLDELVHATTIATNALLGQYGLEIPPVALVTTEGFRDVIEIGRQNRPRLYDLFFRRPRAIVPRNLRFEARERTGPDGKVNVPLEKGQLERVAGQILEAPCQTAAVAFINSYLNPENEREAGEFLSKKLDYVSVSSSVAPEQREYERTSTAVVNAALMPIVSRYVKRLESSMGSMGSPMLSIMASSGGLVSTDEVYSRPVQIVESGPAAGVIASSEIARLLGLGNVISFDMGGTTAKAGTIVGGEVVITGEYEVGGESHHGRMAKGSGYPVRFPFVDLAEVSAGGGTIIWKDQAGGLRIGPVSSGAEPGPICYGKGGTEPTITDANLVLGIIGKELLGGEMTLDVEGARNGLGKLGDPVEIAEAALSLADMEMARAIRIVTVERGLDPSEFAMVAYGGAGPQHAARIADELGIRNVIIPPKPGLFSALGLLYSDWRFEARASFPKDTEDAFGKLEDDLSNKHRGAEFLRYADCRYRGQGSELTVAVSRGTRMEIEDAFVKMHQSTFGFILDREVEVVTIRAFAVIRRDKPDISITAGMPSAPYRRTAVLDGRQIQMEVHSRAGMAPGRPVMGPCAIEDYDSTAFVPEGWIGEAGMIGELLLRRAD